MKIFKPIEAQVNGFMKVGYSLNDSNQLSLLLQIEDFLVLGGDGITALRGLILLMREQITNQEPK